MKVLFICKNNVGRSQMAQALFTKMTSSESDSAGVEVDIENQKISDRPLSKPVIEFMQKEGIDISQNTRKKLLPKMLKKFDKIVVMIKSEKIPAFLLKSNKTIFWDIEDPAGKSNEDYERIISDIKSKIKTLIE